MIIVKKYDFPEHIAYEKLCQLVEDELVRSGSLFPQQNQPNYKYFGIKLDDVWEQSVSPQSPSDYWYKSPSGGGGAKKSVYVSLENNKIISKEREYLFRTILKTQSGMLVGTDYGEFDHMYMGSVLFSETNEVILRGNEIRHISDNGENYPLKTSDCVEGLCLVDDRVFALTGMAHFTTKSFRVEGFWATYTTSMVYANGRLFTGMWGGMMEVNLTNESVKWYVLKESI